MFEQLAFGSLIIAVTVVIHGCMLSVAVFAFRRLGRSLVGRYGTPIEPLLAVAAVMWMLLSHTMHVWLWAGALIRAEAFERLETAVYFALVCYTTLGFGDIILGEEHRMLSGLIAVDGFVLFGWTTAYTISLVQSWEKHRPSEGGLRLPFRRRKG